MFVMLKRLNTSTIACNECGSLKWNVLVIRMSNELKSSPNLSLELTRGNGPVTDTGNPVTGSFCEGSHGTGPATLPSSRHSGNALYAVMAAFSAAPFEIWRPNAFRGMLGSRPLNPDTTESIGTCEAHVQMGETFNFHGISMFPDITKRCRSSPVKSPFSTLILLKCIATIAGSSVEPPLGLT